MFKNVQKKSILILIVYCAFILAAITVLAMAGIGMSYFNITSILTMTISSRLTFGVPFISLFFVMLVLCFPAG